MLALSLLKKEFELGKLQQKIGKEVRDSGGILCGLLFF